jgi:hypothetical protein
MTMTDTSEDAMGPYRLDVPDAALADLHDRAEPQAGGRTIRSCSAAAELRERTFEQVRTWSG